MSIFFQSSTYRHAARLAAVVRVVDARRAQRRAVGGKLVREGKREERQHEAGLVQGARARGRHGWSWCSPAACWWRVELRERRISLRRLWLAFLGLEAFLDLTCAILIQ